MRCSFIDKYLENVHNNKLLAVCYVLIYWIIIYSLILISNSFNVINALERGNENICLVTGYSAQYASKISF
jgi:hypothetical protein